MNLKGFSFASLSALCFTIMSLIVHDLKGLFSPYELVQFRTIWLVLLLLPFSFRAFMKSFERVSVPVWSRALFGGIGLILNYSALQLLPVSTASLLIAGLTTIFVCLGESFFRQQSLSAKYRGLSLVCLGLYLFYYDATFISDQSLYLYPVAGAFFSALAFLSLKKASHVASSNLILFVLSLVTFLIASCFSHDWQRIGLQIYDREIIAVVILSFLTQYFLILSYRRMPATDATVASQTAIFWCLLIDVLWNDKSLRLSDLASTFLVFFGIYLTAKSGPSMPPMPPMPSLKAKESH